MTYLVHCDGNIINIYEPYPRVIVFLVLGLLCFTEIESKACAMKICDDQARKRSHHDCDSSNSLDVRAILLRCPCDSCPDKVNHDQSRPISPLRMEAITGFSGSDSDESSQHNLISGCRRKFVITVELQTKGQVNCESQFIAIKHIYDPMTNQKVPLLNPLVLKIRQEQTLQTYGLQFKQVVNGKAKEEVIDKRSVGFTGCEEMSEQPTCGVVYYQGMLVPGSHGFCCSCDALVNSKRQKEYMDLLRRFVSGEPYYSDVTQKHKSASNTSLVTKYKKKVISVVNKLVHNNTKHKDVKSRDTELGQHDAKLNAFNVQRHHQVFLQPASSNPVDVRAVSTTGERGDGDEQLHERSAISSTTTAIPKAAHDTLRGKDSDFNTQFQNVDTYSTIKVSHNGIHTDIEAPLARNKKRYNEMSGHNHVVAGKERLQNYVSKPCNIERTVNADTQSVHLKTLNYNTKKSKGSQTVSNEDDRLIFGKTATMQGTKVGEKQTHVIEQPPKNSQDNNKNYGAIEKWLKGNLRNAFPSPSSNGINYRQDKPLKYNLHSSHANDFRLIENNNDVKNNLFSENPPVNENGAGISKKTNYNPTKKAQTSYASKLPSKERIATKDLDALFSRRQIKLRRRKALERACKRRLDLITDLVKSKISKRKIRNKRDADEQLPFVNVEDEDYAIDVDNELFSGMEPIGHAELQFSDNEDGDYFNDVDNEFLDGVEPIGGRRDRATRYGEDMIPSAMKHSRQQKRSPHGGGKKNHFKIPLSESTENVEVKPKLVREEQKANSNKTPPAEEEDTNVAEELEGEEFATKGSQTQNKANINKRANTANQDEESNNNMSDAGQVDSLLEDSENVQESRVEDSESKNDGRSKESGTTFLVEEDTKGLLTLADEEDHETVRTKRETPGKSEGRGEHNCGDNYTPPNVDPAKYHESAHCLRYSDLWYTVYDLRDPMILHTIYFQLFEKVSLADGTEHWQDLTKGKMIRLGTLWPEAGDEASTIAFTYRQIPDSKQTTFALNPKQVNVLIPQPVDKHNANKYPQAKGGPNEFLVVNKNEIGQQCNMAGIGYQGFVTQENRCSRPKGSCLKNQPADMWKADMDARDKGQKGRYFLGNYGTVPKKPIKSNTDRDEFLALEHHGPYKSAVDIEVKADFNPLIRTGVNAQITEVYVDATCPDATNVTVVITNTGLASSMYKVRLGDCPLAPKQWCRAQTKLINIPPQHVTTASLKLTGSMTEEDMHCSVEVVNCRNELVSTRRVRFHRLDRCICVWYCLCACMCSASADSMQCQPMSPQHYHAAGFQGSMPVADLAEVDAFGMMLLIGFLSIFLILLLLGLTKAILGLCCCPIVGAWGLNVLVFHPIRLEEYYEPHLCGREVIYDEDGYPVHPDTHAHTVRAMSKHAEFCLNVIFFLALPLTICWMCCRRACWICCGFSEYDGDVKSQVVSTKHEDHICFETYDDDDDTQYVIEELKRSQESIESLDDDDDESTPLLDNKEADEYVKRLLSSKVVFRNLREPTGGVKLPRGVPWCVRGFFVKVADGYEFTTPNPFKQYWVFENGDLLMMTPPQTLNPDDFEVHYSTAEEVMKMKQLSCLPKGFCVNVRFQDDMDFDDVDDDDDY